MIGKARLYVLTDPQGVPGRAWTERIEQVPFSPLAKGRTETGGFEELDNGLRWIDSGSGWVWARFRRQFRKVAPGALNDALADRVAEYEKRTGETPGSKLRRELREEVLRDLYLAAPPQSSRIWVGLSSAARLLLIAGTADEADLVCSSMRGPLGPLPVKPACFGQTMQFSMTKSLRGELALPEGLSLGTACRLVDVEDSRSSVGFRGTDLDADDVSAAMERGLQVQSVQFELDTDAPDSARFTLEADGTMRGLRIPASHVEDDPADDAASALAAELFVVGSVVNQIVAALVDSMGALQGLETAASEKGS